MKRNFFNWLLLLRSKIFGFELTFSVANLLERIAEEVQNCCIFSVLIAFEFGLRMLARIGSLIYFLKSNLGQIQAVKSATLSCNHI